MQKSFNLVENLTPPIHCTPFSVLHHPPPSRPESSPSLFVAPRRCVLITTPPNRQARCATSQIPMQLCRSPIMRMLGIHPPTGSRSSDACSDTRCWCGRVCREKRSSCAPTPITIFSRTHRVARRVLACHRSNSPTMDSSPPRHDQNPPPWFLTEPCAHVVPHDEQWNRAMLFGKCAATIPAKNRVTENL